MSKSLREAVRDAEKKKKKIVRTKHGNYFKVNIQFNLETVYQIEEFVAGDSFEEAEATALQHFNARKDLDNLMLSNKKVEKYTLTNIGIDKVQRTNKCVLSEKQRQVVNDLAKGYKLSPNPYGNSYTLIRVNPKVPNISRYVKKVMQMTVKSLWIKGVIISPELLNVSKNEIKIQKALGTLPKHGVLVINMPVVTALNIKVT